MVTQAQLARKWGLSKTRLSQMKKEGMPLSSVEEADAWRAAHYGASRISTETPSESLSGSALPPKPESVSPEDLAREDLHGLLARLITNERHAWQGLEQAHNSGNKTEIMSCQRLYGEAVKHRIAMEGTVDEILMRRGKLITTDEAKELFGQHLQALTSSLKTLPARLAARCNPSDPELAKTTLTEAMNRVFKTMNKWNPK